MLFFLGYLIFRLLLILYLAHAYMLQIEGSFLCGVEF
jgi:hypothetical protein